ncbi:MAG: hypothetical protein JO250_18350 [Armatimonadetes bacterium]|nr:hypothetical protein [Armatimonadota bacterium]
MTTAQTNTGVRRKGWKTTGWQGITVQTPPDWSLVGYGGDAKSGNVRVDNGAATGSALGLEVRWSQVKGKITDADLERRLEPFFKAVAKGARKQKGLAKTETRVLTDDRFPERDAVRAFGWRADRKAVGRLWHCTECGRLCIAQVVGSAGGDFTGTANDVLASLECHSSEAGWRTWALYDLLTQVPTDYALKGPPQLMNIYLQLNFQRGQSLDTLSVEQWSVANVQLRGAYLDEWYRSKNGVLEPTLRYEPGEAAAHGHPALELIGRRGGLHYWAGQAAGQVMKLHRPATHFAAVLWECPESNKITLVQSLSRSPQPDLVREIVERTPCH